MTMSATAYLFAANAVVWLGVAGYLAFLAMRQRRLDERLNQLELMRNDGND
jgi:CcmD family protein